MGGNLIISFPRLINKLDIIYIFSSYVFSNCRLHPKQASPHPRFYVSGTSLTNRLILGLTHAIRRTKDGISWATPLRYCPIYQGTIRGISDDFYVWLSDWRQTRIKSWQKISVRYIYFFLKACLQSRALKPCQIDLWISTPLRLLLPCLSPSSTTSPESSKYPKQRWHSANLRTMLRSAPTPHLKSHKPKLNRPLSNHIISQIRKNGFCSPPPLHRPPIEHTLHRRHAHEQLVVHA